MNISPLELFVMDTRKIVFHNQEIVVILKIALERNTWSGAYDKRKK